ncbi:hypothetical protein [Sporosarcina koreensis]|uniref:Uncharacterized protein n=1 Tax=Sporosarcina koreensis TaxID=334735 RepID=A0ABW0TWH0_9BACL
MVQQNAQQFSAIERAASPNKRNKFDSINRFNVTAEPMTSSSPCISNTLHNRGS